MSAWWKRWRILRARSSPAFRNGWTRKILLPMGSRKYFKDIRYNVPVRGVPRNKDRARSIQQNSTI
eukprot:1085052-Karenia_brevis.AAC.1